MPKRLGRYENLKPIASEGLGTVFRAHDPASDNVVAIQVIGQSKKDDFPFLESLQREARLAAAIDDSAYLELLQQEARLAASLDHSNIAKIHDFQFEEDTHYLVTEFIPDSLGKHIRGKQQLSQERVVEIAIQICKALEHAHANGVIHRDIKPQNVLLTEDGTVKLNDLGIARAIVYSTKTLASPSVGTPFYMAPEQWTDAQVDGRADIYSLGVLLYELLTGARPFNGSVEALYEKHQKQPVPPIPAGRGVPKTLEKIIFRAMEKLPDDRFNSAGEMATALESAFVASIDDWVAFSPEFKKDNSLLSGQSSSRRPLSVRKLAMIFIGVISVGLAASAVVLFLIVSSSSSGPNQGLWAFGGAVNIHGADDIEFRDLSEQDILSLSGNFLPDRVFSIERDTPLEQPITISVKLSSMAIQTAAGFSSRVVIQLLDDSRWTPLETTVNLNAGVASASVNHLSVFALTIEMASTAHCDDLPASADPSGCRSQARELAKTNPFTPRPLPTYTPQPTYTPYPTPTFTPDPTYTPRPLPTYTPQPTYTPYPTPTFTPYPTYTPRPPPTSTPRPPPTSTPRPPPTSTPRPTSTPVVIDDYGDNRFRAAFAPLTVANSPLIFYGEIGTPGDIDSFSFQSSSRDSFVFQANYLLRGSIVTAAGHPKLVLYRTSPSTPLATDNHAGDLSYLAETGGTIYLDVSSRHPSAKFTSSYRILVYRLR